MCFTTSVGGVLCTKILSLFINMKFFKLFVKFYTTIFLLIISTTVTLAPVTLNKPFGTLQGIQFVWNKHGNYGWMSDTLGGKFNFYYLVETMVTDGIFVDAGKDKIVDDIMNKLQVWYVKQIHDKVTATGITTSTIRGWTNVMDKVDIQSV